METKSLDENQRGPAEARLCAMQPARKVLCKKAEDGGGRKPANDGIAAEDAGKRNDFHGKRGRDDYGPNVCPLALAQASALATATWPLAYQLRPLTSAPQPASKQGVQA